MSPISIGGKLCHLKLLMHCCDIRSRTQIATLHRSQQRSKESGRCSVKVNVSFMQGCGRGGGGDRLTTERPLSSSFCPQVALRNADHKGKGYDAGRIDLLVLRATNPRTNVFAYKRKGTNLGHGNEVLFAARANLTLTSSELVSVDYTAGKYGLPNK